MSMWEPFTDRARRTVVLAQEEAMIVAVMTPLLPDALRAVLSGPL